eukprot:7576771-Lingulodinium_polyedra.AAC.1
MSIKFIPTSRVQHVKTLVDQSQQLARAIAWAVKLGCTQRERIPKLRLRSTVWPQLSDGQLHDIQCGAK